MLAKKLVLIIFLYRIEMGAVFFKGEEEPLSDAPENPRDRAQVERYKLVMGGDGSVGKSCFVLKYVKNVFTDFFISTIGVDYLEKTVEIDGVKILLQIVR